MPLANFSRLSKKLNLNPARKALIRLHMRRLIWALVFQICFKGLFPCSSLHSLVEIDHEIFSMIILSLELIEEGKLSVSGKRMYKYWITA